MAHPICALPPSPVMLLCPVSVQFTDIISQSDALRFLHKHQAQLGEALLHATLEQVCTHIWLGMVCSLHPPWRAIARLVTGKLLDAAQRSLQLLNVVDHPVANTLDNRLLCTEHSPTIVAGNHREAVHVRRGRRLRHRLPGRHGGQPGTRCAAAATFAQCRDSSEQPVGQMCRWPRDANYPVTNSAAAFAPQLPSAAALAVIDSYDRGQLLGCLSISDLRGILPEHFEQVWGKRLGHS